MDGCSNIGLWGLEVKSKVVVSWPFQGMDTFPSLRTIPGPSLPIVRDGAQTSSGGGPRWLLGCTWLPEDQEVVRGRVGGEVSSVRNRTDFAGCKGRSISHNKVTNTPTGFSFRLSSFHLPCQCCSCESRAWLELTGARSRIVGHALPRARRWNPCPYEIEQQRALLARSSNPVSCPGWTLRCCFSSSVGRVNNQWPALVQNVVNWTECLHWTCGGDLKNRQTTTTHIHCND